MKSLHCLTQSLSIHIASWERHFDRVFLSQVAHVRETLQDQAIPADSVVVELASRLSFELGDERLDVGGGAGIETRNARTDVIAAQVRQQHSPGGEHCR